MVIYDSLRNGADVEEQWHGHSGVSSLIRESLDSMAYYTYEYALHPS